MRKCRQQQLPRSLGHHAAQAVPVVACMRAHSPCYLRRKGAGVPVRLEVHGKCCPHAGCCTGPGLADGVASSAADAWLAVLQCTVVTVEGQDKAHLLMSITGGFSSVGVTVVSASITSDDGHILDVFRVQTKDGKKVRACTWSGWIADWCMYLPMSSRSICQPV